jgi:hypothetical protein
MPAGLAGGWRIVYFRGVTERWRDVAHIGHAELLTPTPEASLEYFTALLGLTVAGHLRLARPSVTRVPRVPTRPEYLPAMSDIS